MPLMAVSVLFFKHYMYMKMRTRLPIVDIHVKGILFLNKRYIKGVPVMLKWYMKG